MQNTRPASCLNGQKQNIDRTGCIGKTLAILLINLFFLFTLHLSAIPPPINIIEIQYTHNATYTWSEEHQTYAVQAWTEFGIECNSVASADINVYVGEVTWYEKTTSTSGGQYIWSETHVGKIDRQTCVFGNKDGFPANSTRFCMAPEQWMEYDSTAYLSEQTSRIQNLTKVLPFEHLVYNINVFC